MSNNSEEELVALLNSYGRDERHKTRCESHPNIAMIKYWGKENVEKNTPSNGSLSITLDVGTTITEITYSQISENEFFLNGVKSQITKRIQTAIDYFGRFLPNTYFHIESTNDFPTAAGFASSAAGAAALIGALAGFVGNTCNPIEFWGKYGINLTRLARQVSGSGCRSMYGGFVEWIPGNDEDSIVNQIYDENYWSDLIVISIPVKTEPKKVSSTVGMQRTLETCPWMNLKTKSIVPQRIIEAKECISKKDFESLAEIIMRESNELHASCAASFPPIFYLNDTSRMIINAIHELNEQHGKNIAAYSFDAGPNPFIFTEKQNETTVIDLLVNLGFSRPIMTVAKIAPGISVQFIE